MHNDDDAFLEFDIRRTYIVFARGNARTAHASHGIHSEMKVDAVDIIVIAAIVSSCYYTWDKHTRDYVWAVEYTAEDDDAEGAAREIVTHPSRNCNASGEKALIVILELTYSGSRPIETTDADVLGEEIMKNLFSQCTCTLSDDYCFQWTLAINQMNYSRTESRRCGASQCALSAAETLSVRQTNATLGLIHVVVPHSAITPRFQLTCLQQTVLCALVNVDPKIQTETFVQAVLSSEQVNTN